MKTKTKKDPYEILDDQFKTMIVAMGEDEIRNEIATVALNQAELMIAKTQDQHLQEKKEEAKEAGAVYREGTKFNKLKISYARQVLEDRGKV